MTQAERNVLCEGYFDRAFWDGWLGHLGCVSALGQSGGATDPGGRRVDRGHYAYRTKSNQFLRLVPCKGSTRGQGSVWREAENLLADKAGRQLAHLVLNVDDDGRSGAQATQAPGPSAAHRDKLRHLVTKVDPNARPQGPAWLVRDGLIRVELLCWHTSDRAAPGIPEQQTLERLVCAAIVAAYPRRGECIDAFLQSRPDAPPAGHKEHAGAFMAGWNADQIGESFYKVLWTDSRLVEQLRLRLAVSGAWDIAAKLAE